MGEKVEFCTEKIFKLKSFKFVHKRASKVWNTNASQIKPRRNKNRYVIFKSLVACMDKCENRIKPFRLANKYFKETVQS